MYETYYHFQARPFQLSPDPRFFFSSRGHRRAMAYLVYGVHQAEGFLVITGEIGAGKTTLARTLARQLEAQNVVLAQVVRQLPWGPHYVRVAAQAIFSPQVHLRTFIDPSHMSGHARCTAMLRALLPDLPARVFKERIWIVNNETTYCIGRWVQAHGTVTASNSRSFGAMVRNAVDFLAAGMAAPVGAGDVDKALELGPR